MLSKLLFASVPMVGLVAPATLPAQAEAADVHYAHHHEYHVLFRRCGQVHWHFAGEFHSLRRAEHVAHHYRERGFEVLVR